MPSLDLETFEPFIALVLNQCGCRFCRVGICRHNVASPRAFRQQLLLPHGVIGSRWRVYFTPRGPYGAPGGTSGFRQMFLEPLLMEGNMRPFLIAALVAIVPVIGPANAADGCGPGCHATAGGACVVDGWATGAPVWNECPAGASPRPPCGYGYAWRQSMRACFPRVGPNG